jgi:hypothetical protein
MTELSFAAQAVLDAANGAQCYGPDDCLNESRWIAAAALRAAALYCKRDTLIILSLADELEDLRELGL